MAELCKVFDSRAIDKPHFIEAYERVHEGAFSRDHSEKAWEVAGVFPFDLDGVINSSLVKKCADLQELFSIHITPPTSPIQSEAF